MDKARTWLEKNLHYRFNDETLFQRALTHRSASADNNERLEYLGDAVLDFVISDLLFKNQPDADEGDLSRLRASLVCDASLAGIAADLELGQHLLLGSGERKSGGHRRESILADALEALFAAVYLDAGYAAVRTVIESLFANRLQNLPAADDLRDPKTRLQEWLQARKWPLPEYELVSVSGKAHQQYFKVLCTVQGHAAQTRGEGSSRRYAEQQSAERMLLSLRETAGE